MRISHYNNGHCDERRTWPLREVKHAYKQESGLGLEAAYSSRAVQEQASNMHLALPTPRETQERVGVEMLVLVACARTTVGADVADQITALVKKGLDWDYLLQKANWHGTLPLLYWSLNGVCREMIPEDFLKQIQRKFQNHVQRNLFYTRELIRLIQLLEAERISALPFKGPVLAASVYGNVSLRDFCDLDIIVLEKDVLKARDILVSQGYTIQEEFADDEKAARLLSKKKDYRLKHKSSGVIVELHWRITGKNFSFPFDVASLWERLERISIAGKDVLSIPSEDLLLILCVHGAKHCFGRLEWICDIAELVHAHQDLDWLRTIEQARALGSERMLLLGLFLANDLLQAPLPREIQQRIEADSNVKLLGEQTRKLLLLKTTGMPSSYEANSYRLKLRERRQDKLRLGFHYFSRYLRTSVSPNGRDMALLPLPGPLSFLYYVLRPIRLITKFGLKLLRDLRR
jgi:hypothetical protein